jgi:hypothetical protein
MKTSRPRPIQGWGLEALVTLDASHPSILRFALQASPLRRQGIFLALSHLHFGTAEDLAARLTNTSADPTGCDPLKTIGTALITMRVRDIVQALHPGVDGLLGVIRKLGDDPLHPLKYRTLVQMLSEKDQRRAKVLRLLESITEFKLTVLHRPDPAFLSCLDLIESFRSTGSIEAFNAAVALIRRVVPNATDEELVASIKALGPNSTKEDWAQRWIAKALFPALPPLDDDHEWVVLRSGAALRDAADRFRNCLKGHIGACALARRAFVEWKPQPAIIELVVLCGVNGGYHFALEAIHGHQNGRVDPATISTVCRKLKRAGILLPAKLDLASKYNEAAALLNALEFDGFRGARVMDDEEDGMDALIDEVIREMEATA